MSTQPLNAKVAGVIHLDAVRARRAGISRQPQAVRTSIHMDVDDSGAFHVEPMKVDKRDALMMLASSLELANYLLDLYAAEVPK